MTITGAIARPVVATMRALWRALLYPARLLERMTLARAARTMRKRRASRRDHDRFIEAPVED